MSKAVSIFHTNVLRLWEGGYAFRFFPTFYAAYTYIINFLIPGWLSERVLLLAIQNKKR